MGAAGEGDDRPQEVLVDYHIDPADAKPGQEITFSYYVRLGDGDWKERE